MARVRLDKLIGAWDPIIRAAFNRSIRSIKDAVQIEQVVRMIEKGDVEAAIRAVGLDPVNFRPFDKAVSASFEAGGNATMSGFPSVKRADGLRTVFQFDVRNPAAERWLSERSSTKITQIVSDQKIMVRETLVHGMELGNNPRKVALDIAGRVGADGARSGGVIGLTSSQAQWARNYEAELRSENPKAALVRNLRDRRFDRTVRNAAESGTPLTDEQVTTMVTTYENRALRYRAETIARTEAMASLHESQQQAIEQAVETGGVSKDAVSFIWRITRDDRTREAHIEMAGQEVAMGEMFVDGDGNQLEFPGDPNAPPETTINCRCWREPSIDFLQGIE